MLSEHEKFLFDVNGYLVVEDILEAGHLKELNDAFDQAGDRVGQLGFSLAEKAERFQGEHRRDEFNEPFDWPKPACLAFRKLLSLPASVELMLELIGDGFRYDTMKGTIMKPGTEGYRLHGAGGIPGDLRFYRVSDGRMSSGLMNISFALTDVNPGDGGFGCIPGSHKANFRCPVEIRRMEAYAEHVRQVPVRAGSAVVFTETLVHGTLPWTGASERRTVFARYSPGAMMFRPSALPVGYEDFAHELTPLQRAIFEPPYYLNRPKISELLAEESRTRVADSAPGTRPGDTPGA
ncbi:phytanoyl-CoA dioxygenase family protein [Streptomyces sp. N50]|uniref:phytanoyl-CoA dioxygenase family protein n=1 Tax=Streptomyces sp. N50 TaxID=3081765 RepID=UPI0029622AF8|nr:phytanoyl-CoA dioxygenase family protein [Streptomyces sp. N50]WOX07339.1 phytanoyl-CoA dioxygenase family protein [Streptomyces sp. N50]